ncbi:20574_t:CDS:2 [Entrophospora sp. SA101]|nr:20574_t:CDS:2 [Entrophospora sp. SA101]
MEVDTEIDEEMKLKLNYYKENNWERRYINSAQKLIYDVYQVEISNNENDGEDDLTSQIYKHKHIAHNSNELDLYLKDPNAQEKTDVLLW